MGYFGFQVTGSSKDILGFEIFDLGFFCVGKFSKDYYIIIYLGGGNGGGGWLACVADLI